MSEITARTDTGKFRQSVTIGHHRLAADESVEAGGDGAGPSPHDFVLAGLGACTSMTVKLYADRKGWPLRTVEVRVTAAREGDVYAIKRSIRLDGDLDEEQRARLLEIAGKCPVHKTLTGEIRIDSTLG
ncbi:MAG: OsmC family protein [Acidobacteriota bacterium]